MAKMRRKVIGSVCKSKDKGKPDYIKVRGDHVLKDGQFLNLESKEFQLANFQKAVEEGKLGGDVAKSIEERINKIPDFVRFEISTLEVNDN